MFEKLSNYLSTKKRHDRQTKLMNNASRCVDLYNKLLYSKPVPYRELANDIVSVFR